MKGLRSLQYDCLHVISDLADGEIHRFVSTDCMQSVLCLGKNEVDAIVPRLLEQNWVIGTLGRTVALTPYGAEVLSDFMEKTFAEEEAIVLNVAVELSRSTDQRVIFWKKLEAELPKLRHRLHDLVNSLEERNLFLHEIDEGVVVGPKGYKLVDGDFPQGQSPLAININTGHGSPVTFGNNNVVSGSSTINSGLDKVISDLVDLIKTSTLSPEESRFALKDIEEIRDLALGEKSPATMARVTALLGNLKALGDVAGFAVQMAPFVPQVLAFFQD